MKAPFSYIVGTLLLLTMTLTASKLTAHRTTEALAQPLSEVGLEIAGFEGKDNPPLAPGVLRELRASSYLSRSYTRNGIAADLFIAYYAQQRAGESMHSPKHCLPGAGWEIWDYSSTPIQVNGRAVDVNKYSIVHENNKALVLYWYQSKKRIIASEYMGKILLARDALLQNSTAASIVRIIVPDSPQAFEAASALATGVVPEVQKCFGR